MAQLIIISVAVAVVLILLLGRVPDPEDQATARTRTLRVDAERFESLCAKLLVKLRVEVRSASRTRAGDVDFVAVNPADVTGGDYIVQCVFSTDNRPVEPSRVLSLSDGVKAERALKGIMITTGRFSPEVFKLADAAPLALIDGEEFCRLLERYSIAKSTQGAIP